MQTVPKSQFGCRIYSIKLFEDNYSYIIQNPNKELKELILVDPAQPEKVNKRLKSSFKDYKVSAVLYTHKHWDHAGNSDQLQQTLQAEGILSQNAQFVLSEVDSQNMPAINHAIPSDQSNYKLDIFGGVSISTFIVPCHTKGHVLYLFEQGSPKIDETFSTLRMTEKTEKSEQIEEDFFAFNSNRFIFTGDTIFIGGCGRFFEGNAADMHQNMKLFKGFPKETEVFCGHEYAVENLNWGSLIQFENQVLAKKLQWMKERVARKLPSIPSTVYEENLTNVFLRFDNTWLHEKLQINDEIEVLNQLRTMKNQKDTLKPIL